MKTLFNLKVSKFVDFFNVCLNLLFEYLPYIISLLILFSLLASLLINRIDLGIRGLIIAIPAFIAAIFIIKMKRVGGTIEESPSLFSINKKILHILFIFFFSASILILYFISYRPWYYFFIISVLFCFITIEIFSDYPNKYIILSKTALISINLIYGVTLKYPLYYSATDNYSHVFFAKIIYLSGHTIPPDLALSYENFPLYHIYLAISSMLTGLDIGIILFLITGLIYTSILLLIYEIVLLISRNSSMSLLTCLLFTCNPTVIFYGTYVVTRVMAFIGFIILFYLLLKNTTRVKKNISQYLIIIVLVYIILVHQVSFYQIFPILLIFYIVGLLIDDKKNINPNFLLTFAVMAIGYTLWVAYPFYESVISGITHAAESESITYFKPSVQIGNEFRYLITNFYVSFEVFFIIIAIGGILLLYRKKQVATIALFCLTMIPFYIPNPLQLFWASMVLFRADRMHLFLSIFFVSMMSIGFFLIIHQLKNREVLIKIIGGIVITSIFFYSYTGFVGSSYDCKDFVNDYERLYFNQEELTSFTFIYKFIPYGSGLSSDYYVSRYVVEEKFALSDQLKLPFYTKDRLFFEYNQQTQDNYVILRDREFYNHLLHIESNIAGHLLDFEPSEDNQKILRDYLYNKNMVYNTDDVSVYSYN